MGLAEMTRNSGQNVFAVHCELLTELAAYQLGVQVPTVRPFGLYAYLGRTRDLFPNPFAAIDVNTGSFNSTVLVPRSWLAMETSFLHALRAFVEAVTPPFPLNFTVVRSYANSNSGDVNIAVQPPPQGERLGELLNHDENVFVESNRVLQYRCGLFLPQLPNMLSFYEFHSMHLPLFIPGRDWLYRLFQQRRGIPASGNYVSTGVQRPMRPPLFNADIWSTHDTLAHWIFLYDR